MRELKATNQYQVILPIITAMLIHEAGKIGDNYERQCLPAREQRRKWSVL
jgi:hypothetical protein